jgi:hypothetical protein
VAIADWLQRAGIVGLLVFILVGGAKRVWVFGYQLHEMQDDRDRWRDLALKLLGQATRSADVADRSVSLAEKKLD